MGRSHTIQTNFTAGELSPLLRGREDVQKFFSGVEKLENFVVKPQGGAWRRSGTEFIAEVKSSAAAVRLIEFEFSTTQAYILEFGNLYMRVYRNGGIVVESDFTITGITAADPAVVTTSASHGYSDGDHVIIEGSTAMPEVNGRRFTVANKTATTFELTGEDATNYTASTDGTVKKIYEVATPWATADLDNLYTTQSADVLYVAHPDYEPRKITRTAHTTWTVSTFDGKKGPYLPLNSTDVTMRLSDVSDTATAKASAPLQTITGITQANPAVVTSTAHGYSNGDNVYITGVAGMTEVNSLWFVVANKTANTFELSGINSTGYAAYSSGGTSEKGIFDAGDLNAYIEYTDGSGLWGLGLVSVDPASPTNDATIIPQYMKYQSFTDYNFILYDGGAGVLNLQSAFAGTFNFRDKGRHVRASNGTWYLINTPDWTDSSQTAASGGGTSQTARTLVSNYAQGTDRVHIESRAITATLTASSATFLGTADDVGRWVRLNFGNEWVDCEITAHSSTTVCTVSICEDTPIPKDFENTFTYMNDGETVFWRLGAWSEATGWPSVVTFHQQRLWFAATSDNPDSLWSSKVDDYDNFQPTDPDSTVTDESAIAVTVAGDEVNAIKWMTSGPAMLFGTLSAEYQLRSASTFNEPLTPTNIDIRTQTNNGTMASHKPQRIGSSILFIQRAGRKVMDMRYSFEVDSFTSRDMTVMSEHILRDQTNGLRLRYQKNPNSLLWITTGDGELIGLTFEGEQEVFAWHRHILGGTDPVVESIAAIPSSTGTVDELWMVVKRTVNSATVRYVERLLPDFNPSSTTDKDEMKFVDSMLSGDASSTTVYGLNHLEGEELQVVVDGDYVGDKTVSNGTITLDATGTTVIAGLKYTSKIKTLPVAPRGDFGAAGGGIKALPRIMVNLLNSIGFKHGRVDTDLWQEDFRGMGDDMDQSPALFTGWKDVNLEAKHDRDGQFWIVQDQPFPLNVMGLVTVVEASE